MNGKDKIRRNSFSWKGIVADKNGPACGPGRFLPAVILLVLMAVCLAACGSRTGVSRPAGLPASKGKMELTYATQFSVDYLEGDYALITIAAAADQDQPDRFLMVPEGAETPENLDEDIVVIQQPFTSIYLAASSAMDFFRQLDALDAVTMTSTNRDNWSLPEVQEALDNEEMFYVGKYSAPDYETIVDENCGLAIESTMIYHTPAIKEKLETMGVPVMVERSSYEAEPMGRMEWIKLYGLLAGKSEEADQFFQEQVQLLTDTVKGDSSGKKVGFFSISSAGLISVRKPGDYVSKMIDMAGGAYVPGAGSVEAEDNALSTMNMNMESFYNEVRDADILIYDSTIQGELQTIDQLIAKNKLFSDFKAVKEGNVWCARADTFQQVTGLSRMISEFYQIFHDQVEEGRELEFMFRLK